jgi:glycosyltransferase involved in cell wall biosynthesis
MYRPCACYRRFVLGSTTITIVTPCRNSARFLPDTIESILGQTALRSGRATLQYLIQDGASTDGTREIVERFADRRISFISERDTSMYDALRKGFVRARGDVVAYLNAGDVYHRTAFDTVLDVFEDANVCWLTGAHSTLTEQGRALGAALPFRYRRRLIRAGLYGPSLPWIQQESTFWRRELLALVDLDRLAALRLAGDYFLWFSFAEQHDLYIVEALLGAFRVHGGQLSEHLDRYIEEMRSFCEPPSTADRVVAGIDAQIWRAPTRIKKMLNERQLLRFDHERARFR